MIKDKRKFFKFGFVASLVGFFFMALIEPELTLIIHEEKNHKVYVKMAVQNGDKLSFNWIHSWEKIPWNEDFTVNGTSLVLDTISFPAFGAGIPENKGKRVEIKDGMIIMSEIDEVFPHIVWLNSNEHTREIKINDKVITSGAGLPEHTKMKLIIRKRRLF